MFALADMNNDGLMDIIFFTDYGAGTGTNIALGNGHGFDSFKFLNPAFGTKWNVKFHIRSIVDVDGDGWPFCSCGRHLLISTLKISWGWHERLSALSSRGLCFGLTIWFCHLPAVARNDLHVGVFLTELAEQIQ
jgi:hypothetical protein